MALLSHSKANYETPYLKQPHVPSWFFRSFGIDQDDSGHEIMSKAADEDHAVVDTDFNERWYIILVVLTLVTLSMRFSNGTLMASEIARRSIIYQAQLANPPDPNHESIVLDWIQQILFTKLPTSMLGKLNLTRNDPAAVRTTLKRGLRRGTISGM